jgi:outer membrane biosynthesis protein TonB
MPPSPPSRTTRHQWLTAALLGASALTSALTAAHPQAATAQDPTPDTTRPPITTTPDPTATDTPPDDPTDAPPQPADDPKGLDFGGGVGLEGIGLHESGTIGETIGVGVAQGAAYGLPPAQRAAPTPKVTAQKVSGSDDITQQFARRLLNSKRAALLTCYADALRATPTLSGALDLTLDISPQGQVAHAAITRPLNPALDAGALSVARALTFPTPQGDSPTQATVRLVFKRD